jgi:hypothetical protein
MLFPDKENSHCKHKGGDKKLPEKLIVDELRKELRCLVHMCKDNETRYLKFKKANLVLLPANRLTTAQGLLCFLQNFPDLMLTCA